MVVSLVRECLHSGAAILAAGSLISTYNLRFMALYFCLSLFHVYLAASCQTFCDELDPMCGMSSFIAMGINSWVEEKEVQYLKGLYFMGSECHRSLE